MESLQNGLRFAYPEVKFSSMSVNFFSIFSRLPPILFAMNRPLIHHAFAANYLLPVTDFYHWYFSTYYFLFIQCAILELYCNVIGKVNTGRMRWINWQQNCLKAQQLEYRLAWMRALRGLIKISLNAVTEFTDNIFLKYLARLESA